jgi:hypothetical protein
MDKNEKNGGSLSSRIALAGVWFFEATAAAVLFEVFQNVIQG